MSQKKIRIKEEFLNHRANQLICRINGISEDAIYIVENIYAGQYEKALAYIALAAELPKLERIALKYFVLCLKYPHQRPKLNPTTSVLEELRTKLKKIFVSESAQLSLEELKNIYIESMELSFAKFHKQLKSYQNYHQTRALLVLELQLIWANYDSFERKSKEEEINHGGECPVDVHKCSSV